MFKKIKKSVLLIFMVIPAISFAQQKPVPPCATMDMHEEKMKSDSNYRKEVELVERQIQAKLAKDDSINKRTIDSLKKSKTNRKTHLDK
jgi:hypothetical protein